MSLIKSTLFYIEIRFSCCEIYKNYFTVDDDDDDWCIKYVDCVPPRLNVSTRKYL
jgi:hypothetical protein